MSMMAQSALPLPKEGDSVRLQRCHLHHGRTSRDRAEGEACDPPQPPPHGTRPSSDPSALCLCLQTRSRGPRSCHLHEDRLGDSACLASLRWAPHPPVYKIAYAETSPCIMHPITQPRRSRGDSSQPRRQFREFLSPDVEKGLSTGCSVSTEHGLTSPVPRGDGLALTLLTLSGRARLACKSLAGKRNESKEAL